MISYINSREMPNMWHWYQAVTPKPLIDGTRSGWCAILMRRKLLCGVWQYRQMTDTEFADWDMERAW
jgi:hypothetical protein